MSGNQEQHEYWDGVGGQRWTAHQEALDRMVRPFGLAAIERLALRPGEHVLDVGCGCGDTLLALAEGVGERARPLLDHRRPRGAVARKGWPRAEGARRGVRRRSARAVREGRPRHALRCSLDGVARS